MKSLKISLAAGALAIAMASGAHAQTVIRITGSTAFRSATVTAISNVMDAGFTMGYVGGSFTGAVACNFSGTVSGTPVLIKTCWTGSEGGIQTVSFGASPLTVPFLQDGATTSAAGAGGTGGTSGLADPTVAANPHSDEIPDVAMSDTYQSSSAFFGLFKGKTYPSLTESPNSPVGVIPFIFVSSKSAPTSGPGTVTNITTQLAQNLFSSGKVQLSLFTGVSTDTSSVLATGRDPDSGTRLTLLAEVGLGSTASVKHYQPSDSSGVAITTAGGSIAKAAVWPASTVNTIGIAAFNGGYNSGGKLANAMTNTSTTQSILNAGGQTVGTGGWYITLLGQSDAGTATGGGAHALSYNGVAFTVTDIQEGHYTAWGYEHMYYRSGAVGTTVQTVADIIANRILQNDSPVLISSMHVGRSTDGAKVQ